MSEKELSRFFHEVWRTHVKSLPTRLGFPYQTRPIYNWGLVFSLIEKNLGKSDIFSRVFPLSYEDGRRIFIDEIFIDIDAKKLEEAYDAADLLSTALEDDFGASPRIYFSGRKGFHLHVDFRGLWTSKRAARKLVTRFLKEYEFVPGIDRVATIDLHRMCRVPYTIHSASGLLVVPVDLSWGLEKIVSEAVSPEEILPIRRNPSGDLGKYFLERLEEMSQETVIVGEPVALSPSSYFSRALRRKISKGEREDPPCVKRILERAEKGINLTHPERFFLVTYLSRRGYKTRDILEVFRKQPDFDERKTLYQIRHILGYEGSHKRYSVPSCEWMKENGLCVADCGIKHPLDYGK